MSNPYHSEFKMRNLSDEEAQSVADWITQDLRFALTRFAKYLALVNDMDDSFEFLNLKKVHEICKPKLVEAINLGFIPRTQDSEYFEA